MNNHRGKGYDNAANMTGKHSASLNQMDNELDLRAEIQGDVSGLTEWLQSFELVLLSNIWIKILQCIDDCNKMPQNSKTYLEEETRQLKIMLAEIKHLKDS
ncbi:hypothetical protein PR048_029833 [Dryococelus australis]|uniref:Uncharacterized protein n=1 Tax=Dryococelus australis TaxID=614101 RepID=A0ABQ9GA10_9NEOP|nr:hypothetical protein PR048_029832 [Dryococelus australis]KAJ8868317.1 hypothetical protein PR048_029833 [Dryococelus australis]